jgi:hypothetical protein
MSDEKSVPETLDTLAARIAALGQTIDTQFTQIDGRFAQIDGRFEKIDGRFDELKSQLRTEIEAVRSDVTRVYDALIAQAARNTANDAAHAAFTRRLDQHDLRLLALEQRRRKRG